MADGSVKSKPELVIEHQEGMPIRCGNLQPPRLGTYEPLYQKGGLNAQKDMKWPSVGSESAKGGNVQARENRGNVERARSVLRDTVKSQAPTSQNG